MRKNYSRRQIFITGRKIRSKENRRFFAGTMFKIGMIMTGTAKHVKM
jgi:hypothetical protein